MTFWTKNHGPKEKSDFGDRVLLIGFAHYLNTYSLAQFIQFGFNDLIHADGCEVVLMFNG